MMQTNMKKPSFRCIIVITDSNIRDKLSEFLTDIGLSIAWQMHGIGTASSEFLNLCGLGSTQKSIALCFVQTDFARLVLAELNQALQLHKRGTGIALSIPVSALSGWLYKVLDSQLTEQERKEIEENEKKEVKNMRETITHALILVTANQGFGDAIMSCARAAGATGGTMLKGLRCSPKESAAVFGFSLQEEEEIIAIVVPQEKRTHIMTEITKHHGPHTPSQAACLSLPVDAIAGL
ncbi:MAG: hypothetical protein ACI4DR_06105 [Roseburia sp.]